MKNLSEIISIVGVIVIVVMVGVSGLIYSKYISETLDNINQIKNCVCGVRK